MKYKVNLMPVKEASVGEKLVYFTLNYLRYIIVITQLIVISVFFYRFQIDQRIIELKEGIEQKREIIQLTLPLLSQAEMVHTRTTEVRNIFGKQEQFSQMMNYLISIFPDSLTLDKLEIDEEEIKMSGFTENIQQLQLFYNFLRKESKFETISLDKMEKVNNKFNFSLILNKFKL